MDHGLFKPKGFDEGKHAVVGNCNGYTMEERWNEETPLFAKAICAHVPEGGLVLDYGCGVGRLAAEVLKIRPDIRLVGTDASKEMLQEARQFVNHDYFETFLPHEIGGGYAFDLIYCVYVLQHIPAIEIRDALYRIYQHLKDDGTFVYCSSDYRMAIRHDNPGFFDDRFLGVNLRQEVQRLFQPIGKTGALFTKETLSQSPLLSKMITGQPDGLAHPALVYKKKRIDGYLFDAQAGPATEAELPVEREEPTDPAEIPEIAVGKEYDQQKLLLVNRLAPGDCLVMTNALRDLHKAFPDTFLTDVRTPCNQLFENNPYITNLLYDEIEYLELNKKFSKYQGIRKVEDHIGELSGGILVIDMHYPMIHTSGTCGWHFCHGHTNWLEKVLQVKIPVTDIRPELYLSQNEQQWPSPVLLKAGYEGRYWAVNGGSKGDFTLKQYPYYQEVATALKAEHGAILGLVQIGAAGHNHQPLDGAIDMVGKTDLRELIRLIAKADGVITCVSLPMHIAAALKKPCVVIAGGREGTRWELYPNHQFLYTNGCLPCAPFDGCWRSKDEDCNNKVEGIPRCMKMIRPDEVARAVGRYYEGGILEPVTEGVLV